MRGAVGEQIGRRRGHQRAAAAEQPNREGGEHVSDDDVAVFEVPHDAIALVRDGSHEAVFIAVELNGVSFRGVGKVLEDGAAGIAIAQIQELDRVALPQNLEL